MPRRPAPVTLSAEAKPPEPPYTLTGNFGIYSQYIFRGLTQTDEKPAFQGGFDFTHESGFYLGTWGSNISWLSDSGACNHGCSLEWDFYGGWKHTWNEDWGLDLGVLQYYYPGSYNPGFYERQHDRALHRGFMEVAVAQILRQRQQQDLRHPQFAEAPGTWI